MTSFLFQIACPSHALLDNVDRKLFMKLHVSQSLLLQPFKFVNQVTPGSPGDLAGFHPGDVVTEFDGKPVVSIKEVFKHIPHACFPTFFSFYLE